MARLDFRGGAAKCTAGSAVTITQTTITLVGDTSGWPTGASGRNFVAVIDRGVAGKMEKVLCSGLTGPTLTIVQRGYDGTTAIDHDANCAIEHGFGAAIFDDLSRHVYDTASDDHTQYVPVNTAVRGFSNVVGIVDVPVSVGSGNAIGGANKLARSDHVHGLSDGIVTVGKIGDGAVISSKLAAGAVIAGKVSADAIDQAAIAAGAVGTAELIDANVTTPKLADSSVTSAKIVDGTIVADDLAIGSIGGVLDVATQDPGSGIGGTAVTIATINIPAQPHAYNLVCSAFWSGQNSTTNDTFSMSVKVDGNLKGKAQNRHAGGANVDMNYSVAGSQIVTIAASTACTVIVQVIREAGSGNITQSQAGRLVVTCHPKSLAS